LQSRPIALRRRRVRRRVRRTDAPIEYRYVELTRRTGRARNLSLKQLVHALRASFSVSLSITTRYGEIDD
jgi:hypothetical protein